MRYYLYLMYEKMFLIEDYIFQLNLIQFHMIDLN